MSSPHTGESALVAGVPGVPNRFPSRGLAICIVNAAAAAVDLTGHAATADMIGTWGIPSLALYPGENRILWVQAQAWHPRHPPLSPLPPLDPLSLATPSP